MFESIDSLGEHILNIQLLDLYFKDGSIRMEDVFFNEDYIYQMQKTKNLLKCYKDNGLIEDSEYEDDELPTYTFDDVLERLINDLDLYSVIYKVPPVKIENVEWELLFATIANYYVNKEYSYNFMDDMIYLNQMVIARAMVYEEESISIETYIRSLKYIESDDLIIDDIIEIVARLGEVFGIDSLSLIVNKDGSYSCVGKDMELLFIDDESDEDVIKKKKEILSIEGYKTTDILHINKEEEKLSNSNIVDFASYKSKTKKKN